MGTISKSLSLLNYFSTQQPQIGLTTFRTLTGQDKATVHRHLVELTENGFLEQDPATRLYRLGPAILRLAAVREATFPARAAVQPIVDALSQHLGELVHVSLYQKGGMSPLYHKDARVFATRVSFDAGQILPLHATASGLAMLAFGPETLFDSIRRTPLAAFTEQTVTDHDALDQLVTQARIMGYAECDQGFDAEVCSFAVPVFGPAQSPIGTLACALPTSRVTRDRQAEIARALLDQVDALTVVLGGTVPQTYQNHLQTAA